MSINPLKAEKNLSLGSRTYKARMSLDTIMRVEDSLGCSILGLANKLSTGDILLSQMLPVIYLSVRAGGNDVTENDIKSIISEIGYVESVKVVGELLTLALDIDNTPSTQKKSNP